MAVCSLGMMPPAPQLSNPREQESAQVPCTAWKEEGTKGGIGQDLISTARGSGQEGEGQPAEISQPHGGPALPTGSQEHNGLWVSIGWLLTGPALLLHPEVLALLSLPEPQALHASGALHPWEDYELKGLACLGFIFALASARRRAVGPCSGLSSPGGTSPRSGLLAPLGCFSSSLEPRLCLILGQGLTQLDSGLPAPWPAGGPLHPPPENLRDLSPPPPSWAANTQRQGPNARLRQWAWFPVPASWQCPRLRRAPSAVLPPQTAWVSWPADCPPSPEHHPAHCAAQTCTVSFSGENIQTLPPAER